MASKDDPQYASKTYAAISRAQWDDYEQRYQPIEDELVGMIGNTANLQDQLSRGDQLVDAAFGTAKQSQGLNLSMYGVASDAQTDAAHNRGLSLAHAAAKAGSQNTIRTSNYDRDLQILTGASSDVRSAAGV